MSAAVDRHRCSKVRYRNKVQARKALDRVRQALAVLRIDQEHWPIAFYRCRGGQSCRGWHLTSRAQWPAPARTRCDEQEAA